MTSVRLSPLPLTLALAAIAVCAARPAFAAGAGGMGVGVASPGGTAYGGPAFVGDGGISYGIPGNAGNSNGLGPALGGLGGASGLDRQGDGQAGQAALLTYGFIIVSADVMVGGGGGSGGIIIPITIANPSAAGGAGGTAADTTLAPGGGAVNRGTLIGGGGGAGGAIDATNLPSYNANRFNARGGTGGVGMSVVGSGGVVQNTGSIWGGGGGGGGAITYMDNGVISTISGRGGDGGAGVVLMTDNHRLINTGDIRGGIAGAIAPIGSPGVGGVGVQVNGNGNVVVQQGAIMAGLGGIGSSREAISVPGNNNTVELGLGSITVGTVLLSGTGNRLQLSGGSTATVAIDGGLVFGGNGIYTVRATPTAFDKLDVSGLARLSGATVQVLAQPGAYSERFSQVVLTAAGAFGGSRFAGATSDLAYLTPSLSYSSDDKQVTLTLARAVVPPVDGGTGGPGPGPGPDPDPRPDSGGGTILRFADLVSGRNARAAANAVETMPASNSVYSAAINLPVGAPQGFFAALSGEAHASVASGLNNLSGTVRNMPLDQLRGNLAAGSAPGAPTAAAGVSDAAPLASALPASQARPAWAQLVGNWQSIGASGGNASARQHTGGVIAGADRAIGGGWRLGGAVGYTDSRLSVDDLASRADVSSYSAVVYGGKAFDVGAGKLNLLAGAAYSWHDIHTRRQLGAGGLDQTLTADYGGNTTQVFTELGYAFGVANGLTLEPYAGVAWAGQRVRGFSESGGSAALSGESSKNDTTTTTLGLRGKQAVTLGTMAGSVSAGLGWRHAFGDLTPASRVAFDAGQAFTVTGAPISRDAALVELGADLAVNRSATVGLAYAGQYASGNRDHTGRLEVRWQF